MPDLSPLLSLLGSGNAATAAALMKASGEPRQPQPRQREAQLHSPESFHRQLAELGQMEFAPGDQMVRSEMPLSPGDFAKFSRIAKDLFRSAQVFNTRPSPADVRGLQAKRPAMRGPVGRKITEWQRGLLGGASFSIPPEVKEALRQEDFLGFDRVGEAASAVLTSPDFASRWAVMSRGGREILELWRREALKDPNVASEVRRRLGGSLR